MPPTTSGGRAAAASVRTGSAAWAAASLPRRVSAERDAAQDLAEALEAGHGPGGQEVVDVREGRAHPAGERLVAGRAGQRVEPDQPMAVAAQSRGLGRDERPGRPGPSRRSRR